MKSEIKMAEQFVENGGGGRRREGIFVDSMRKTGDNRRRRGDIKKARKQSGNKQKTTG